MQKICLVTDARKRHKVWHTYYWTFRYQTSPQVFITLLCQTIKKKKNKLMTDACSGL